MDVMEDLKLLGIEAKNEYIEELEQKLEQSNAEKQQWKQCAHTLADVIERLKDCNEDVWGINLPEVNNALEQFKKLRDQ